MGNAESVFSTLAKHESDLATHDQAIQPTGNAESMFGHMAANNGQPPTETKPPQGSTIGPSPQSQNFDPGLLTSDPFTRAGYKMAAPFARKAMDAVDKLREIESFTQEGEKAHPVQAFMGHIANKLEGFLFGNEEHQEAGLETSLGGQAKGGILNNPVTAALIPGAEGEPALAGAIRGGAGLVREGMSVLRGGKAAEGAPGLVKQVLKGEKIAQEPAKAAIRGAAGAEEESALLEGNKTVLDEPLKGISAKEKAAYAKQDEAAGFDVKETRKKLSDAEYKVKQPEIDDATRTRLEKTITESKQSLAEAEKKMSDAGVDVKAADRLHQQRMAGQDFKKALVQHVSPDGESVNVDGLLNASKKLRFSKYGDRLEQFLGKEGAEKYMDELQKAQDAGVHALKMREGFYRILKLAGGLGAVGTGAGAIVHALKE